MNAALIPQDLAWTRRQHRGHRGPEADAGMAEDALKIISLVFEDAGPDGGPDHDHDALVLIDLPMDDRPARDVGKDLCQLVECPTATSEVVASAKLILASQHDCGGLGEVGSEGRIHPSATSIGVVRSSRRRPRSPTHPSRRGDGASPTDDPNHKRAGYTRFKRSFGGQITAAGCSTDSCVAERSAYGSPVSANSVSSACRCDTRSRGNRVLEDYVGSTYACPPAIRRSAWSIGRLDRAWGKDYHRDGLRATVVE
jgi:hypothetical protein